MAITLVQHRFIENWGDIKDQARNIEIETEEGSGISREEFDIKARSLTADESRWDANRAGAVLFHVPGFTQNEEIENALEEWGRREKNLVVGILRKEDPAYGALMNALSIEQVPAIVIAGVGSPVVINKGIEVRMPYMLVNDHDILMSTDDTLDFLENAFTLFQEQEFADAVSTLESDAKKVDHNTVLKDMGGFADNVREKLRKHKMEIRLMKGTLAIRGR